MIEFLAETTVEGREWIELVARTGGNPMHLPEINRSEFERAAPVFLVAREGREVVACALGYSVRPRRWRLALGRAELHLPTAPAFGPGIASSEDRDSVYEALVAFARERNFKTLFIHARWGDSLRDSALMAPYTTHSIVEFLLDCNRPLEAIQAGMHRFHRKNIRKAARDGLAVESDSSLPGLLRLRELQQESAQRSARRGAGFGVHSPAYFKRVQQDVYAKGLGEIYFARAQGEIVAGLACIVAAGKVLTVRSGSTPLGYRTGAMYLLQDAVIRRSVDLGARELNIGGVPEDAEREDHPQHGLYEFKKGFGGIGRVRSAVRMPLDAGNRR